MFVIYGIHTECVRTPASVCGKDIQCCSTHLLNGQTFGGRALCIICNSTVFLSPGFVVNLVNPFTSQDLIAIPRDVLAETILEICLFLYILK